MENHTDTNTLERALTEAQMNKIIQELKTSIGEMKSCRGKLPVCAVTFLPDTG